jgi:branched-chain amino acid transport system permease protein
MNQLIINTIYNAFLYYIVAFSFSLLYNSSKKFYISHAAIIMLAPYIAYSINYFQGPELPLSIILGILISTLIGFLTEIIIYRKMRSKSSNSLIFLVASLGIYIVFQNFISILFGDEVKSFGLNHIKVANKFIGGYITNNQALIVIFGIFFSIAHFILYRYMKIGKMIRAFSSNNQLSRIYGIESNSLMSFAFILGSFSASIAGILYALDKDIQPTMGFNIFLYGVISMIIGGSEKLLGLLLGAFVLSLSQNIAAFFMDISWMDAIAYCILIVFLMVSPTGISGQKLKKVEI